MRQGHSRINAAVFNRSEGVKAGRGGKAASFLKDETMKIAEFFLDEPYVVKTNHFLFSPDCFVGVAAIKNDRPNSLTVIDEKMRVWGVCKDAVQIVEKEDWPEWAVALVASVKNETPRNA